MPLGITSVFYLNTGTYESPTWLEIDIISDFMSNIQWDEGDTQTRESRVKRAVKTLLAVEFTGSMRKKIGDTGYNSMMQAAWSDEIIDVMVLDGPMDEVGSEGVRADCQVFNTSQDQGPGVVLFRDITIKPTLSDHKAYLVRVAAGPTLEYAEAGGDAEFGPIA